MYHARFKGTHYEAGLKWGSMLHRHGIHMMDKVPFAITGERREFAKGCLPKYEKYFPEILDEIRGIADGQKICFEELAAVLLGMYCFCLEPHCTCFAAKNENEIFFARNSDFLVSLEKYYMNVIYDLQGSYRFNANTTAYVEMEDGVNECGLAVGLTFVYPKIRKPGLSAGLILRGLLEKCASVEEALDRLMRLPIASSATLTLADAHGDMAVVECNPEKSVVLRAGEDHYVCATNNFVSCEMKNFRNPPGLDDFRSGERYETVSSALKNNQDRYSIPFAKDLLAGKYGFMCQYDRKTNADTVWSVVYDLKNTSVWRCEGNPCRKKFTNDERMIIK